MAYTVHETINHKGIVLYQVYIKIGNIEKPIRGALYKKRNDAINRAKWEELSRPSFFR